MTTSLIYLASCQHITDRQLEAHRHRLAAELRTPRRRRLTVPRLFARGVARTATA